MAPLPKIAFADAALPETGTLVLLASDGLSLGPLGTALEAATDTTYTYERSQDTYRMANVNWNQFYPVAMQRCSTMIFLLSHYWLNSQWCWQELQWFVDAAKPFRGMEVNVLSETIPTHEYESRTLTKAFEEITGIKVNHQELGEGEVVDGVLVTIEDERFASVERHVTHAPDGAHRLVGLTVPGMANCHSHAFHRALRGRTQRGRGTFWTWREQMYGVAARLTPDTYYALARATYREMVLGGITCVGEFHYLHHGPDGTPYDDPNAMGHALLAAAADAGIRITLLDTCYLAAGIGKEPEGVQLRFRDGDAVTWAARADDLRRAVNPRATRREKPSESDGSR